MNGYVGTGQQMWNLFSIFTTKSDRSSISSCLHYRDFLNALRTISASAVGRQSDPSGKNPMNGALRGKIVVKRMRTRLRDLSLDVSATFDIFRVLQVRLPDFEGVGDIHQLRRHPGVRLRAEGEERVQGSCINNVHKICVTAFPFNIWL